jgi:hypothetical protein
MEIDEHIGSSAAGSLNTTGMADKLKPAVAELDFNVELLKVYYDKAFPYELMYKWLSYFKTTDADTT